MLFDNVIYSIMEFKQWFLENDIGDTELTPEALLAKYETQLMQSPEVKKDLETRGLILIATVAKLLGTSEGMASYVSRHLNKKYQNHDIQNKWMQNSYKPDRDEYYYHVTLNSRLKAIKKHGLQPWSEATFTNYQHNTKGKIFFCEKDGVGYWMHAVENHEFHNTDNPQGVVVLRIKKEYLHNVQEDKLGTSDSRLPAYYVEYPVPPDQIELVKKKVK